MAHGLLALVAGILLLAWPDRTLLLIGVIIGVYLIAFGVLELIKAFSATGQLAMERVIPPPSGCSLSEPGRSPYAAFVERARGSARRGDLPDSRWTRRGRDRIREPGPGGASAALGVVNLAAGIVVVAWPDVTVTAVAVVIGIALTLRGAAEILLSIFARSAFAEREAV